MNGRGGRGADDGGEISRSGLALLPKTEAGKRPVRLLGIAVSNLRGGDEVTPPGEPVQLPLFGKTSGGRSGSFTGGEGGAPPGSRGKEGKLNPGGARIRGEVGKEGGR